MEKQIDSTKTLHTTVHGHSKVSIWGHKGTKTLRKTLSFKNLCAFVSLWQVLMYSSMKTLKLLGISLFTITCLLLFASNSTAQKTFEQSYLDEVKSELQKTWPKNRTINIVFFGHSVPSGYFLTPEVKTLESYPYLTLKKVKELYPTAVVNTITSTIGGENAVQGVKRLKSSVFNLKPDVLFIDYALNDRRNGLEESMKAWEKMVKKCIKKDIKLILMTPTPDLNEDILSTDTPLAKHSEQIRKLAKKYNVGLVDSYAVFKALAQTEDLKKYMAQKNHINELGHEIVAEQIISWFMGYPSKAGRKSGDRRQKTEEGH